MSLLKLVCIWGNRGKYFYIWVLFLYLLNGKYFVNERINYVFLCSGMLFFYYLRFCNVVGFGVFFVEKRDVFFKMYKLIV